MRVQCLSADGTHMNGTQVLPQRPARIEFGAFVMYELVRALSVASVSTPASVTAMIAR